MCSKFFTKPNGSKPTPQQTTLSFATKSADKPQKAVPEKTEESEDEELAEEAKKAKPASQDSPTGARTKENSTPVSGELVQAIRLLLRTYG